METRKRNTRSKILLLYVSGPDTCNLFGMTHCIALNDEEEVIQAEFTYF
jgi:hypothetical protein